MDEPIVGEIRLAAFDRIPAGWAACDGQSLAISDYRALYDVIGTRYGGDGRSTFALPDLRGRVAMHASSDYPIGAEGGAARHALTIDELPAHHHDLLLTPTGGNANGAGSTVSVGALGDAVDWTAAEQTRAAGSHDNMQPYLGLVFMIALGGQSPERK